MDYTRDKRILAEAEEAAEPVICFRAKDRYSPLVLSGYLAEVALAADNDFVEAVVERLREFRAWQAIHETKIPDLRPGEPC